MNELPSADFRKVYAKLTETTRVTVNGHIIGQWIPQGSAAYVSDADVKFDEHGKQHVMGTSQAQRDDLLRKINRGK